MPAHPTATPAEPPPRRRVPVAVLWLCALHTALMVGYTLLVPTWRGPDEANHVDAVLALREDGTYPAYDDRIVDPGVRGALQLGHPERRARNLRADEATDRSDRPTLEALEGEGVSQDLSVLGRPGLRNHITQHPPGYYLALAGAADAVALVDPGDDLGAYDSEVDVLRLLSLLLAAPLPLVVWWVARLVGLGSTAALTAAVLPLAIPQLTHIASVVNNDGLLAVALGVLSGLAVRLVRGHVGYRSVAVTGLVAGAALFVKGLAFAVLPVVVVALLVGRRRVPSPPLGTQLAVLGGITLVTGGWWWLANLVNHGRLAPSIEHETRFDDPPVGFSPDFGEWLGHWVPHVAQRFWGDFGWLAAQVPPVVAVGGTAVAVLGIAAAITGGRRARHDVAPTEGPGDGDGPGGATAPVRVTSRMPVLAPRPRPRRRPGPGPGAGPIDAAALAVLVAPFLLLHLLVAVSSYRIYADAGFAPLVQGRYLFGGVAGLAVLVAAGWTRVLRGAGPMLAVGVVVGVQVAAIWTILTRYWGSPGAGLLERLDAVEAWSPWPFGVNLAIFVAVPLTLVPTVRALRRGSRRPPASVAEVLARPT